VADLSARGSAMTGVYVRFGVEPIVNAKGPGTRLSGGIARPEVRAAMADAVAHCVDLVELHARASEVIARHTGAEAGLVTSGAAAGLLLGTAACITGLDPGAMARLPLKGGARGEVVMVRSQRNQYDHALRTTGLEVVEVGLPDRYAGAGCRDAEPWEIADAINDTTKLVHWVADLHSRPPLEAVVEVAHARGVPVLVDAAAQLPPKAALRSFIRAGADLVTFSGGKALGGPQASGILCGRRDLIAAAAMQMLDMDYPAGFFRPPPAFIDTAHLAGLPPHGIGRPCKVGKEQIVGLLVALELFVAEDDEARHGRWLASVTAVADRLHDLPGVTLDVRADQAVPTLALSLSGGAQAATALYEALVSGRPSVHLDPQELTAGLLVLNPMCLAEGDDLRLIERLRAVLTDRQAA
jgi:D-glucosaminate-6-phosphate ammonia-lyase